VQILLFSGLLALLATGFQLFVDYRRDVRAIQTRMDQIESSYVRGLENSLWTFDAEQVNTQLEGILKLPDLRFLELTTVAGERFTAGALPGGGGRIERAFTLRHGTETLGTFRITASLEGVFHRLRARALVIALDEIVQAFFFSIFILLVLHRIVTQPLGVMADYTRRMDLDHLDQPLDLARRRPRGGEADELDDVARAINEMRLSLLAGLADRTRAEDEIRSLNAALERRVLERTQELKVTNDNLSSAKEAADEASLAKSRFLASMSHELRTPLNAILLYCELLRGEDKLQGDPGLLTDLSHIRNSGKHLLSLINNILDMAKIESGKMILDLHPEDLPTLMQELVDTMRPLAKGNQNRVDLDLDPAAGLLNTDGTKLRQILLNFLGNACKFTSQGVITLGLRLESEDGVAGVRFWVRDTGIGMSAAQATTIFTEFAQAEASTARKFGGTGLGLAISHRFSHLMGGRIWVESEETRGSCFHLRLPLAPPLPHLD